jgi:hypothetical protein
MLTGTCCATSSALGLTGSVSGGPWYGVGVTDWLTDALVAVLANWEPAPGWPSAGDCDNQSSFSFGIQVGVNQPIESQFRYYWA